MSRSGKAMLAVALIMTVAVIVAVVQKAMQKTVKASAAAHPVAASSASSAATATSGPAPAAPAAGAAPAAPAAGAAPPASSAPPATPDTPPTSAAAAAPPAPRGTDYANPRFGFSFDVPAGYRAGPAPTDGDGLAFTSPAGTATVSAYGANNALGRSPAQELAAVVSTYRSARDTITYRFFRNDLIAVSGTTPHGRVFYQREIVYPAVIYTLLWTYPAAGSTQYDALVTQTVDSFVPGPAHSG